MAKLLAGDLRLMFKDRQSAKPLGTNVVVALAEEKALAVAAVMEIGEVEEQTDVECLPDRAETRHQPMIEAREMLVLE